MLQTNVTNWSSYLLRVVFAFGATWVGFMTLLTIFFSQPQAIQDASAIGEVLLLACVVVSGVVMTIALCQIFPRFLVIPLQTRFNKLIGRGLGGVAGSGIGIGIVFGAAEYVSRRLADHTANTQYGVSILMAAIWYPAHTDAHHRVRDRVVMSNGA